MSQKIILANWKMQLDLVSSLKLAREYVKKIKDNSHTIIVCPDYVALAFLAPIFTDSQFKLGAQNCAPAKQGALTGEVSPQVIRSLGANYVIIGHSERRARFQESPELIRDKIIAALEAQLQPVVCLGETEAIKLAGQTKIYLRRELKKIFTGLPVKSLKKIIIAYEPVWAISTNQAAKPMKAQEASQVQQFIKAEWQKLYQIVPPVLYGGSVKADNAQEFLAAAGVDGLLVGGASLQVGEFVKIVK
ncbi:MAG: triose-phosphate isomerase [Patescibacteria group bacterium]|jgi:triosephosphate isomerase